MVVYQHTDTLNRLDLKITLLEPRVHWQEKNIHKKNHLSSEFTIYIFITIYFQKY